jgi:hypothetical protein
LSPKQRSELEKTGKTPFSASRQPHPTRESLELEEEICSRYRRPDFFVIHKCVNCGSEYRIFANLMQETPATIAYFTPRYANMVTEPKHERFDKSADLWFEKPGTKRRTMPATESDYPRPTNNLEAVVDENHDFDSHLIEDFWSEFLTVIGRPEPILILTVLISCSGVNTISISSESSLTSMTISLSY